MASTKTGYPKKGPPDLKRGELLCESRHGERYTNGGRFSVGWLDPLMGTIISDDSALSCHRSFIPTF